MPAKPLKALPTHDKYEDVDAYVDELLAFVSSSTLLKTLISSVHILDFFTQTPDLYESIIDAQWRQWLDAHDFDDLLSFLLHENIDHLIKCKDACPQVCKTRPPQSLLEYLSRLRTLSLVRDFDGHGERSQVTRQLSVGMKPKKIHEVDNFARYVQKLTAALAEDQDCQITHLVDFGAGQGYLGRFLASEPNNRNVIAVESKGNNVEVSKAMDVLVKLAPMSGIMRNKKEYRSRRVASKKAGRSVSPAYRATRVKRDSATSDSTQAGDKNDAGKLENARIDTAVVGKGSVQHVEHQFQDGNLHEIVSGLKESKRRDEDPAVISNGHSDSEPQALLKRSDPRLLVLSLHSCGNLSHHALRSLTLNPAVRAVAVIGCCYNLLTERLGPQTYKSDYLRPDSTTDKARLAERGDPQGFPMSDRLAKYQSPQGTGLSFDITARMMAVQAPTNWSREEADSFITRHFFRALLQRILVDRGIADPPTSQHEHHEDENFVKARSPAGGGGTMQPIIIGSLNKSVYTDFPTYARAAITRVQKSKQLSDTRAVKLQAVTDDELDKYATQFEKRRKDVGIMWTLMALSATLVEAAVVVDRWQWLREQEEVERCWAEPVFDYKQSPRNIVVVGLKKPSSSVEC